MISIAEILKNERDCGSTKTIPTSYLADEAGFLSTQNLQTLCTIPIKFESTPKRRTSSRFAGMCLQLPDFEQGRYLIPGNGLSLNGLTVRSFTRNSKGKIRLELIGNKQKNCGYIALPTTNKKTFETDLDCVGEISREKLDPYHVESVRVSPNFESISSVRLLNERNEYCGTLSFKTIMKLEGVWRPSTCLSDIEKRQAEYLGSNLFKADGITPRLVRVRDIEKHMRFDFKDDVEDPHLSGVLKIGLIPN